MLSRKRRILSRNSALNRVNHKQDAKTCSKQQSFDSDFDLLLHRLKLLSCLKILNILFLIWKFEGVEDHLFPKKFSSQTATNATREFKTS